MDRREWFDDLYRVHHLRLVRLAYMLTSESGVAEEIAQEAFVRTWRSWDRIREPEAAGGYLRTTVVHLARSRLRRRALERRHRMRREDPAVTVAASADRLDILDVLRRLPPRQRACIALRFYEDQTEAATADLLGVSVGTVKSQTHKALRRLKELIGGDEDGT